MSYRASQAIPANVVTIMPMAMSLVMASMHANTIMERIERHTVENPAISRRSSFWNEEYQNCEKASSKRKAQSE